MRNLFITNSGAVFKGKTQQLCTTELRCQLLSYWMHVSAFFAFSILHPIQPFFAQTVQYSATLLIHTECSRNRRPYFIYAVCGPKQKENFIQTRFLGRSASSLWPPQTLIPKKTFHISDSSMNGRWIIGLFLPLLNLHRKRANLSQQVVQVSAL